MNVVWRNALRWLLLFVFLVYSLCASWAIQTDNHGIHAVPTTKSVQIDGKLNEWDLSGKVLQCYDIDTLKDVYSGEISMMYDKENLYITIHWKDPIPMGNCHDPRYQTSKGWAGDSVQFRLKTDRICHVTAWYYAPSNEPFLAIDYGKSLTEPFGGGTKNFFRTTGWKLSDGAEMAFQKDTDGAGYVQEIKLPWKLITLTKAYSAGDQFSCGIELLWGEADWPVHRYADNLADGATSREFFWTALNSWGPVFLESKGHLSLPTPSYLKPMASSETQGPVEIRYSLPTDARVTLAINDAQGKRVRNLVPALPRKKGRNIEHWDGLDDNGKPVQPGNYKFIAIYHQGIHSHYVMSFCSPGNPSWQTPDGRGAFYGDHAAAEAAAAGGQFVALGCKIGEAGQHLIGCDLTGQRLWGLANRVFGDGNRITLATDGKLLWVGMDSSKTFIYRVDIATGKYIPWNTTGTDENGNSYRILELPVSDLPGDKKQVNLTAIALNNSVLAICLARENRVDLRDADTGAVLARLAVDSPRAVAFDTDGSLVVLSNDRLLRLTRDGKSTSFTNAAYPAGYGLAIDAQRNVYLSVRGDEKNIKVFSADGTLVREIGKHGGRAVYGPYDPNGMREPGQIAIDAQGRIWVPETSVNPKRTSIWSCDGQLLKELVGTTSYAGAGAINPDNPTMGFAEDTIFSLDLTQGTWKPTYSLGQRNDSADLFPPTAQSRSRVVTHNGCIYLYTTGSADDSVVVHCAIYKDGVWRSVARVGMVRISRNNQSPMAKSPLFAGHDGQAFSWIDLNGDGLVQEQELTFASGLQFISNYWGQLPSPDGTIYYTTTKQSLVKLPITGYTACDAPIYDILHPQIIALDQPILKQGEGMVMGGSDGRIYLNQDPLAAVDANGKVLFTYPSTHISVHGSHSASASRPGYLIGPSSILGTANFGGQLGEVFYLNGNLGENYLFTADGLYIQTLFKDTRGGFETPSQAVRGMSFDATTAGGESFGGNFVRTRDGHVYLVQGGTDARVLELTGFETIKRFDGSFSYTPAQYTAAQSLAQQNASKQQQACSFRISRVIYPLTIDGNPRDWPELVDENAAVVEIREDAQQRYARVQARYDAKNLYLGYRVFAPTNRMRNVGQDERLLFKTGDAVDLMLSPSAGTREAGNLRVLFSMFGGKPIAVVYVKSVPGTAVKDRIPFSSPWRTIYFDRVVVAPDDIHVASGAIAGGYFVEAQIPWTQLGVQPSSGLKLKGDFGALFADNGGTVTVSRKYWSNHATGLVNDVPGEADLSPSLWGEFTLE